jgi:hypothetical protein
MSETREPMLSFSDAAEIGFKIVEMADRLIDVDLAMPGSQAKQSITIDGVDYVITLTRDHAAKDHPHD